jgi:hypothetical protein
MTVTPATLDDFMTADTGPADFRRDQWGRPSILQPNGRRKGYTRCSSAAKAIEDQFNLNRHDRRLVAYGMAYDSSLIARLIAIGGEPSAWGKPEKDQVNAICDDARTAAKAHKAADIGTAIHHLTHRLDRGEDVVGGPYQADLDAYRYATVAYALDMDPAYTECRMVNDLLEMAGTADRIVRYCGRSTDPIYRVADIKTGQTIEFGGLGWAAQLAAYAGGVLYDVATDERLATPPIDQTVGYIIHLPAGQGRCDIYEVDLVAGHRAAELANEIRKIRKAAKQWIQPSAPGAATPVERTAGEEVAASSPATSPAGCKWCGMNRGHAETCKGFEINDPVYQVRRQALLARYTAMSDDEKLAYVALDVDPTDLDAVEAGLDQVDRFNVHVPYFQRPVMFHIDEPVTPPDEGDPVSDADVHALHIRFDRLGIEAKLWTGTLIAQGNRTFPWRIKDKPTVRRYELYRGVLALAECYWGGEE